jgi:hypothetical protein
VENYRAGRRWSCLRDYSADRSLREPDQHAVRLLARNLVQNLRQRRLSLRYAREQLFGWLPRLLDDADGVSNWNLESASFLSTWRKFN